MQKSYGPFIAVAIVVIVGAAFALSPSKEQQDQPISAIVNEQPLASVQVHTSQAQLINSSLRATGETKANRIGTINAELSGKVVSLVKKNGDLVQADEVIAKIDAADLFAQLQSAKALEEQRRLEYQANVKLNKEGLQNKTLLAQYNAAYQQAKANHKAMQIRVNNLEIRAPFAGVIENINIEVGSFVNPGMTIGRVFDFSPLIVSTEISENHVAKLRVGDQVQVELISGENLNANISFISANANASTRTFYTEMTIDNGIKQPKAGVTAKVDLSLTQAMSHKVSAALLQLDADGELGIKVIDEQDIVHFKRIEIIKSETDGAWIAGLDDTANIITVGQSFVQAGDQVQASFIKESGE